MIEQRIKVVSEALARAMNRRVFLRRAGTGVVSGVTALALGSVLSKSSALAQADSKGKGKGLIPDQISCSPPGPYCNIGTGSLSGCHGGHCFQHLYNGTIYSCYVYYQYYPAGCWTTASGGGYWTCCDCSCGQPRVATCGCAQFSLSPAPLPG